MYWGLDSESLSKRQKMPIQTIVWFQRVYSRVSSRTLIRASSSVLAVVENETWCQLLTWIHCWRTSRAGNANNASTIQELQNQGILWWYVWGSWYPTVSLGISVHHVVVFAAFWEYASQDHHWPATQTVMWRNISRLSRLLLSYVARTG